MSNTEPLPPYDLLGGAEPLGRLVDRFYHHMQALPEAAETLALHDDLDRAREKLRLFLSGWLGGPSLYIEKYGHPRLRARHLPFAISARHRDQWMLCMQKALDDVVTDLTLREELTAAFMQMATHMINQP
ncbi:MAG: group II truncated hemoglobin [Polyangiaceae bacterium]|nr:group II truncated hemoglobin [Polyangiaceae bacterium]